MSIVRCKAADAASQVERAIIGNATGGSGPAPIAASFKPFPWPAVQIDLGERTSRSIRQHIHYSLPQLSARPSVSNGRKFYLFTYPEALLIKIITSMASPSPACCLSLQRLSSLSMSTCAAPGAGAAALAFNLLLVYAFLAPTRSVVAAIVREKELRLREGMRMLGLQARVPMAHMPHRADVEELSQSCLAVALRSCRARLVAAEA